MVLYGAVQRRDVSLTDFPEFRGEALSPEELEEKVPEERRGEVGR